MSWPVFWQRTQDRLVAGDSLRVVQVLLGHRDIYTTARYLRCLLPADAHSPHDDLPSVVASGAAVDTIPPSALHVPQPDPPPELPFPPPRATLRDRALAFYRSLKLMLSRRFLALRQSTV